jgi:hypothetical protein
LRPWQAVPTEALTERLRILRLGKTEHHEVEVIAAQGIRQLCDRKGIRKAADDFAVFEPADLVGRECDVVRPLTAKAGPG